MSSKTSITPINKQHKNVTSTSLSIVHSTNSKNKTSSIVRKIQQPQAQRKQTSAKKPETKTALDTKKKISASAPTTPQHQRRTILPVKARRVQRRKEIVSMTDALIKTDMESASFTESDDSTSSSSLTFKKKKNKPKKTMSEVAVITSKTVTTNQSLVSKKSKQNDSQVRNRRRSSSVIETRSVVYAGPTFNNAPAPSALPLPSFSPSLVSVELADDNTLERHSKDLMNILSPAKSSSTRVQYQHYREFDKDLSEIQKGLRSMLKI